MSEHAFPNGPHEGMTQRDYFAAAALTGLATSVTALTEAVAKSIAQEAYALAEAMLDERARHQQG